MNITVTMNHANIAQISRAQEQALAMTAQQMLNETRNDQVIPFDSGATQNEDTYVDDSQLGKGKVSIITDNPYARRLYFHPEINFKHLKNINARGEWWEEWLEGGKKDRAKKLFKQFFRRVGGGVIQ